MTAKKTPAMAVQRVPLGVYMTHSRESAIAVQNTKDGIWYITMVRGWIECCHVGSEKFVRDFPLAMPEYPVRRALRVYDSSGLRCDDDAKKVIQRLLERL